MLVRVKEGRKQSIFKVFFAKASMASVWYTSPLLMKFVVLAVLGAACGYLDSMISVPVALLVLAALLAFLSVSKPPVVNATAGGSIVRDVQSLSNKFSVLAKGQDPHKVEDYRVRLEDLTRQLMRNVFSVQRLSANLQNADLAPARVTQLCEMRRVRVEAIADIYKRMENNVETFEW